MFTKEDSRSNTLILHNFNSDLSIDSICEITVNLAYDCTPVMVRNPRSQMLHLLIFCMCTYHPHSDTKKRFSVSRVMKNEIFILLKHVAAYK